MDIQTTLAAVLVLLAFLIFVVLVGLVISTVLGHIIRWILKQKQAQRLVVASKKWGLSWWNRHKAGA